MKELAVVCAAGLALCAANAFAIVDAGPSPVSPADVCEAGPHSGHPAGNDQDGDGVPDSEDWCTHTAPGVHVGADGCAIGEVAVSCPRTMAEAPARVVPASPAPVVATAETDSDGDGVPDSQDKCSGTPKGVEVDKHGCVVIEKVVLKGVNFATGSAKLLPAASDTLKTVASAMKADKNLEVEVDGYTDNVGEDGKNQRLSERRAKSVKEFIVKEGVDAKRLSTQGFGKANPVDTNDTPAGRANNRRVSFKVTRS